MNDYADKTIIICDPTIIPGLVDSLDTIESLSLETGTHIVYHIQGEPESTIESIENAWSNFMCDPSIENEETWADLVLENPRLGMIVIESKSGCSVISEARVLELYPEFYKKIGKHRYTRLPNWSGDIKSYIDSKGEHHLIGIGTTDFITLPVL